MLASLGKASVYINHGRRVSRSVNFASRERKLGFESRSIHAKDSRISDIRWYSTANKATAEGTARFFSPERQMQRLKWQKERFRRETLGRGPDEDVEGGEPDYKLPKVKPKMNRKTGWTMGPIGMGTARMSVGDLVHQQAVERALQTGATNVIDSSPNYRKDSEALVGLSMQRLIESERISRDEIVVVDKVGPLLQTLTLDSVKQRAARGRPFKNMIMLSQELGYCLDPEYIEFQLSRSLTELGLECIDLYLIDTPELILPNSPSEAVLAQFQRVLHTAMVYLEDEVKRGRIQYYGISSSKFSTLQHQGKTLVSLDMVLRTANAVGTQPNHFAAVSYPMSLLEPQAAHNDATSKPTIWSKQGRDSSLQLVAFQEGLIQLSSRPLNALIETTDIFTHLPTPAASLDPVGLMYRLAQVPSHDGKALVPKLKATFDGCVAWEKNYANEFNNQPQSAKEPQTKTNEIGQKTVVPAWPNPRECQWAQICLSNMSRLDLSTFQAAWKNQLKPGVASFASNFRKAKPEMDWWATEYEKGMDLFGQLFTQALELNRHQEIEELISNLKTACPTLGENPSLPAQAIRTVTSTLITTTLVGMRSPVYVDDIIYGGGTTTEPNSMMPLDPSYLGNIFDAGARHYETVRNTIKQQHALEDPATVKARQEAAEDKVMSDSLKPRQ